MMTKLFKIDDNGNISEIGTYSLNPVQALKSAFLQHVKRNFNTWDYDKIEVPEIKETKRGYSLFYGENSALYARVK